MPAPLLVVAPHFPSPGTARDGQSLYAVEAARALHELTGARICVAAMRVGQQAPLEEGDWFEIRRAEPPAPSESVFDLYAPERFPELLAPLTGLAARMAAELRPSACWCHGYETAPALEALADAGLPSVAVVHYSVAQETVHDLGCADDLSRRRAVGAPLPLALSKIVPPRARKRLVRLSTRLAGTSARLPLPTPLRAQFTKLAMEARLMRRAGRIVAVGRSFAQSLGELYPDCRERISWCFAGAPPPRAPGLERARDDGRRLLMVGRPMPQKGWEYAADALLSLEREAPELANRLELVVVTGLQSWQGPITGYAANVRRRFETLRRVRFRDAARLDAEALGREYAAADFLLHPSVFEPFGLVIVEALQHGCLVLASDTDGPRDLLRAPFGWLLPFDEPEGRVSALERGLREVCGLERAELDRRREAGRQAAAGFSWESCARGHLLALRAAGLPQ